MNREPSVGCSVWTKKPGCLKMRIVEDGLDHVQRGPRANPSQNSIGWRSPSSRLGRRSPKQVYPLVPTVGIRAHQALLRLVRTDRRTPADATFVALAEERRNRRIFTVDTDFHLYRFRGRQRFETVPTP